MPSLEREREREFVVLINLLSVVGALTTVPGDDPQPETEMRRALLPPPVCLSILAAFGNNTHTHTQTLVNYANA